MEQLYTSDEVAKILKLNKQTVRRFCKEGKIKAVKVGRSYRIKQSDLELSTGGNLQPETKGV